MINNLAHISSSVQIGTDVRVEAFTTIGDDAQIGDNSSIHSGVHIKGGGAKIGKNVIIEPGAVIYGDVEIGDGTWIGDNAIVMDGARIGKNCKIHPQAIISNVPQDLKFAGEKTLTIVGDNTTIRECVTVNRGTSYHHKTSIGSDCLIMAYVHVAHDCIIKDKCIISNSVQIAGHVEIGYHAVVGGSSAIHQFVKVGKHVMIGGGALVRKDVPPYILADRNPLSFVGLNTRGLNRRGFTQNQISQIQDIYRLIYHNGLNNTQAIQSLKQNIPVSVERDTVIDFMEKSDRGIIKGN